MFFGTKESIDSAQQQLQNYVAQRQYNKIHVRIFQSKREQMQGIQQLYLLILEVRCDQSNKEGQSALGQYIFELYSQIQKTHILFDQKVIYAFIATQSEDKAKEKVIEYYNKLNPGDKRNIQQCINADINNFQYLSYYKMFAKDFVYEIQKYK